MSGLVVSDLASAILSALGPPTDKDGHPISVTTEMTKYAQAVVDTLHAGIVANAPGTVVATGAPGAPITLGAATGGLISALLPTTWLADLTSGFAGADSSQLSAEANASTTYLMASGKVSFAVGDITGNCTATPLSGGPLAAGAGSGGLVAGLVGSAWATTVSTGPLASPVYTAVAGYIMANARCAYATGKVVGAFPPTGGPMTLGAGTAGTIA